MTDESGNITHQYAYSDFGEVIDMVEEDFNPNPNLPENQAIRTAQDTINDLYNPDREYVQHDDWNYSTKEDQLRQRFRESLIVKSISEHAKKNYG